MSIPPSEPTPSPNADSPSPEMRRSGPPTPGGRRERHQREQRLLKRKALAGRIAFFIGLIVLGLILMKVMSH